MKEREGYKAEQARNEALKSVNIGKNQQTVLSVIAKHEPISNEQIAVLLGWFPNQVTPRVFELRQLGYVEHCGYTISPRTYKKVSLWRIKEAYQQQIKFKEH
jgi:Mn-dependent DtxR family transcriptional regulator